MFTAEQTKTRIARELETFEEHAKPTQISMIKVEEFNWKGFICGPEGSPYENGCFKIDIIFPAEYPSLPPKLRFETPIWHPNICSSTGKISLNILQEDWAPALTIVTTLISLESLLSSPLPNEPLDAQVAEQYLNRKEDFIKEAQEWMIKFSEKERK